MMLDPLNNILITCLYSKLKLFRLYPYMWGLFHLFELIK